MNAVPRDEWKNWVERWRGSGLAGTRDGTIPDFEPPSWTLLNTYRTNSQIEGGGLCVPPAG